MGSVKLLRSAVPILPCFDAAWELSRHNDLAKAMDYMLDRRAVSRFASGDALAPRRSSCYAWRWGWRGMETALEMVERHIAGGKRHLAQQVVRIAKLEALGLDTCSAETLLTIFKQCQRLHVEHRDRILRETNAPRS
jgi:hypothetical protein